MKKIYLLSFLTGICFLGLLGFSKNKSLRLFNQDEVQYRYTLDVPVTMSMIDFTEWLQKNNFDITGVNLFEKTVEVITNDAGIDSLKRNLVLGFVRAQNSAQDRIRPDSRYFNPVTLEVKLKALNAQFPAITKLQQIGTSLQGRPIWGLLISSTPQDKVAMDMKPTILMDGMHHAREVMTTEVVEGIADLLLKSTLDAGSSENKFIQKFNFWFVPMLNVDGNNIVWTKNTWWRKNSRNEGTSIHGVDINRNYPFKWSECAGSSGSKDNETYRGVSKGSEPEVQALTNLASQYRPLAYLSYHSYGELILYPHGCRGMLTGENELISKIAAEIQKILPSDSAGKQYTAGAPWQILYGVDGDSASHMYAEYGSLSMTYEVNFEFQPKYELKTATLAKHAKAFDYLLQRMDFNLLTLKIVDAETNLPQARAKVGVSTIVQTNGEKDFQANDQGYFFKVLDPGSYSISVQTTDGKTQSLTVVMTGVAQALEIKL